MKYKTFAVMVAIPFALTLGLTAYSFGANNKPLQIVSVSLMTTTIILLCSETKLVDPSK